MRFGELHDQVIQGTAALGRMDMALGSRVALVAGNVWQTVAVDLALLALECTTVHFIADGPELASWIDAGWLDYVISQNLNDCAALEPLETLFGLQVYRCLTPGQNVAAVAGAPAVIFSSGTAGRIKKILVNSAGIVPSAEAFFGRIEPLQDDAMLIFLTLSNYQQKLLIYGCILFGIRFCLTDSANVLNVLKRGGFTLFLAPPVFYETAWKMVRLAPGPQGTAAALRSYFGGRMRMMWSGMAPIAPEILEGYQAAEVPLLEAYGMTEYGPIAMNTLAANRIGSVGRPVTPGSVQIMADGEVTLRSATPLTTGYLDEPAASEVYLDFGHIATGDIGRLDENGFLHLLGRKKEMIVTSAGVKIHPNSVERLFAGIANINHAVLLGDRRPQPGLLVMVQAQMEETEQQVRMLVRQANAGPCSAAPIRQWRLVEGAFTPDNEMLTRNFKLARGRIAQTYETLLFGDAISPAGNTA